MKISNKLLESLPKETIPQLQTLIKMISLGASPKMVAHYLGITELEYQELEKAHPKLFREMWKARTDSAMEVTANLRRLATESNNVEAIRMMLGLLSDEYKEKPTLSAASITQNNIHLTLPSTKEALAYIQSDPSIIEGDVYNE